MSAEQAITGDKCTKSYLIAAAKETYPEKISLTFWQKELLKVESLKSFKKKTIVFKWFFLALDGSRVTYLYFLVVFSVSAMFEVTES